VASFGPSAHALAEAAALAEFRHLLETLTPDLADLAVQASGLTDQPVPDGVPELAAAHFRQLTEQARADAKRAATADLVRRDLLGVFTTVPQGAPHG
jgi:hypothetical protein